MEIAMTVFFLLGILAFDFLPKRHEMLRREIRLYWITFSLCAVFLIAFSLGVSPPNFSSLFFMEWIRHTFHPQ